MTRKASPLVKRCAACLVILTIVMAVRLAVLSGVPQWLVQFGAHCLANVLLLYLEVLTGYVPESEFVRLLLGAVLLWLVVIVLHCRGIVAPSLRQLGRSACQRRWTPRRSRPRKAPRPPARRNSYRSPGR